ncbi:MAG: hypothetical protein ACRDS9_01960 [Pseudonocardiaceae bacterium]
MRSRTWRPSKVTLEGLFFLGAPKLLRELDRLTRRLWLWWRDALLPLVYLVVEPGEASPLVGIEDRLRHGARVVYSRIDQRNYVNDPTGAKVSDLLNNIVADLSYERHRVRRIRFPHYSLTFWLQNLTFPDRQESDQLDHLIDDELQSFIRRRYRLTNAVTDTTGDLVNEFPWYVRLPINLLPRLGMVIMRRAWRPPRWLVRQPIGERHGRSFKLLSQAFMTRTGGGQDGHSITPGEIDLLLVDAFLEDIRRSYRRWTVFGAGRRRSTYPVLLVDHATSGTPGLRLLELISQSRNKACTRNRRRPDPYRADQLLVIARGDETGLNSLRDGAIPEGVEVLAVADIHTALRDWTDRISSLAQDRSWFLPLTIPPTTARDGDRDELTGIPLLAGRPPIMTFVAPLVLAAAAGVSVYNTYHVHCGSWFWQPQLHRQSLDEVRDQCVGAAPSGYRFFADLSDVPGLDSETAEQLREVEERIHNTNQEVERLSNHLTVVYFSRLTSGNVEDYGVELEHLRGMAVAQEENKRDKPVRILFANGGNLMNYGKMAAEEIVAEAEEDSSIVAILGLGISREGTRQAMVVLGEKKLPMVGTTISATELATTTTQYYYQVGFTNEREAQVAATRAKQLGVHAAIIYYWGDPDDHYSNDLKDQAAKELARQQIEVSAKPYGLTSGPGSDISLLGRDACSIPKDGIAFFAGRAEHFPVFLNGTKNSCEGNYPRVIAGDSVVRFVLNGGLSQFPGLDLEYISFASSLAMGPDCGTAASRVAFFSGYGRLFGDECIRTRDGNAMIAYDALLAVTQAARNAGDPHPSRDAIKAGLSDISGEDALVGASGVIDFPRSGAVQSVPRDKAILLLRASGDAEPERVLLCGQIGDVIQSPSGCR